MMLCVDIGNTSTKIAAVRGARVVRVDRVASGAPVDEVARAVARVARTGGAPERALVSSVRPASTARIVRAIERATGVEAIVVTHRTPMPVSIGVRRPERLGTDRLCAACGAVGGGRRSAVVIDAGTAITVDLIVDRRFLGGVILPGPTTSLDALHRVTSRLPPIDFARGPLAPRRIDDTESAMRWGAALGAAGGIRAAAAMLEARSGKRLTTIVTGGHADRLSLLLPGSWQVIPDLTLLGLAAIGRALDDRG
jgi:type III pantothenate kinase